MISDVGSKDFPAAAAATGDDAAGSLVFWANLTSTFAFTLSASTEVPRVCDWQAQEELIEDRAPNQFSLAGWEKKPVWWCRNPVLVA